MSIVDLVVAGALVSAALVFVAAYRHALEHWLAPSEVALPAATLAARPPRPPVGFGRRFHAAAIALAFVSMGLMGLMAVGMIALAIVA